MLIDGGPGGEYNSGEKVILPYLRKKGIRKIDAIALTGAFAVWGTHSASSSNAPFPDPSFVPLDKL